MTFNMRNLILIVLMVLVLTGCQAVQERAEILVNIDGPFLNLNNADEYFFRYYMSNFGEIEGRNLEVTCELFDEQERLLYKKSELVGNIASNSLDLEEMVMDNVILDEEEIYISYCYLSSCDDCRDLASEVLDLQQTKEWFK